MAKRTGPTNILLKGLITDLRVQASSQKVSLWRRIADDLEKPSRQRRHVNLYQLSKHSKENESIIVPGKVLGTGDLSHKINVAAFTFSESARAKIAKANGQCLTIKEVLAKNPKGKDLRIIG